MPKRKAPIRTRTPIASLTPEDREALLRFNAYLADLERFILQQAEPLDRALRVRKEDPSDPMIDYELDAEVTYYLRQDDPAYRDDDDNILAQRSECPTGFTSRDAGRQETVLNGGVNYNDRPDIEGEHHCWLYHDLYDHRYGEAPEHQPLDWPDILRIGSVWLDLQVMQQYHVKDPFGSGKSCDKPGAA